MFKYKNKKPSLIDFARKYANNELACEEFFFKAKYPTGYYCEECGCTHYRKLSTRRHIYVCAECNSTRILDTMVYEAVVAYIGSNLAIKAVAHNSSLSL